MPKLTIDTSVRLTHDLPRAHLRRGDVGVVRSHWFAPHTAYEVEFRVDGHDFPVRALVADHDVATDDDDDGRVADTYGGR